jgi:HAD superfamily hydrolase (TIGR01549 family)
MQTDIKVVLFDLDETLFDHVNSCQYALRAVHATYGSLRRYPFAEIDRDLAVQLESLWGSVLNGSITIEARVAESFRRLADQYSIADFDHTGAAVCYRETYLQARQPLPGAIRLMEILKPTVKIGVVTNHIAGEQQSKLNACKLDSFVDFLVASGELGIHKPDQRIFEHALNLAGCTPQQAVMVGDSWSHDVLGASALGIRAVWLNQTDRPYPDPRLAVEIKSFEPAESVAQILLHPVQDKNQN